MNRFVLRCITMLLMMTSCNKDIEGKVSCNTGNPIEELIWLKEIKNELEIKAPTSGYQIIKYNYRRNEVFWVDNCHKCPDGLIEVYDCDGKVICKFGGIDGRNTCVDFETEAFAGIMLLDGVD